MFIGKEEGGLAVKYRPKTFDEVVGQTGAVESLKKLLERDKKNMPHAFFFSGHTGCGKTTLAYILAREMGIDLDNNLIYHDAGSYTGVDSVRDLRRTMEYAAMGGGDKFYLLDEVHRLSKNAQDALLIALEKTPSHVFFALCTTEPYNVLDTIRGRCMNFDLSSMSSPEILTLIEKISEKEGVEFSSTVKREIKNAAEGSCRNCLQIIDKIKDLTSEASQIKAIPKVALENAKLNEVMLTLIKSSNPDRWNRIRNKVAALDGDPENIRRGALGYLNKVLLGKDVGAQANQVANMIIIFSESTFASGKAGLTAQFYLASQEQ